MLVLTRRKGEQIVMGEQGRIRITVTKIRHGAVQLGIEADGLPIHREEVWLRLQGRDAAGEVQTDAA